MNAVTLDEARSVDGGNPALLALGLAAAGFVIFCYYNRSNGYCRAVFG